MEITTSVFANGKGFLFLAALLACFSMPGQVWATQCHTIKVSTHPNYPPFHFTQDQQLVGPSIELAKQLAMDLDRHIEILPPMPWKRVLMEGKKGNIDMILSLKDTPERKQYLAFSTVPVFANPMSVFVKEPIADKVHSWLDLPKFNGAISAGDKFGDEFDRFSQQFLKFEVAPNPNSLMQMLLKDRIDYIVLGKETGKQILKELQIKDKQIQPVITINTGLIYLAISNKSACLQLMPQINTLLHEYLRRQQRTELSQRLSAFAEKPEYNATLYPSVPQDKTRD